MWITVLKYPSLHLNSIENLKEDKIAQTSLNIQTKFNYAYNGTSKLYFEINWYDMSLLLSFQKAKLRNININLRH